MQAKGNVARTIASHLAVFLLGIAIATGGYALSAPNRQSANTKRYAALNSFAQALSLIANSHVDKVSEQKLIYGGIVGMVGELDPHSAFYSPSQYRRLQQDTQGEFGGIGVELGEAPPYPELITVIPDTPAARAGLKIGDLLVEVNGNQTSEGGLAQATAKAWHSKIRGPAGTRVTLRVLRKDWSSPRNIVLVRQRVSVPSVLGKRYGNVLQIAIQRFREATVRDLKKVLDSAMAKNVSGIILDLRGNPGGLLDKGIAVADVFLQKGTIVRVTSRGGRAIEVFSAHKESRPIRAPMVVLVDEITASSSEIVAAALQDNKRATVIGTSTYGKGSVQTFLDLADGSGLKLTTSRYQTPKGRTLEGRGIKPDIVVEAFATEVITPSRETTPVQQSSSQAMQRKELTLIQRQEMDADLQLFKSYQHLIAK